MVIFREVSWKFGLGVVVLGFVVLSYQWFSAWHVRDERRLFAEHVCGTDGSTPFVYTHDDDDDDVICHSGAWFSLKDGSHVAPR